MAYLIPHLLDHSADSGAERCAVRFHEENLTYGELARRANGLARALVGLGVSRGDRVGICLNKSLEQSVALYGVLKTGAIYVPLDPTSPADRLAEIARDCDIRMVVSHRPRRRLMRELLGKRTPVRTLVGIEPEEGIGAECHPWSGIAASDAVPDIRILEDDPAYIIYTSGSTGVPKGIVHTHRSGLTFIDWAVRLHGIGPSDRLANHSPLHFDMSMLDYYGAASAGATTVVIPEESMKLPAGYTALLEREQVSVLYVAPHMLKQILFHGMLEERDLRCVRWVIFGGESIAVRHIAELMRHLSGARFSHVYGPTEANACTCYQLEVESDSLPDPLPLGEAVPDCECLVVDDRGEPVGEGEVGEMLVRGPLLMRGYWNRPELNREIFIRRPGPSGWPVKYLRTGDLVRVAAAGGYTFVSRVDGQVKIRGYRVELPEIEAALLSHDSVREAFVLCGGERESNRVLWAAVESESEPDELIEHIRKRLAPYAVPERILVFDSLPRTSAGKVDATALRDAFGHSNH